MPKVNRLIEARSQLDLVRDVLEGYAERGVFRGFSAGPVQGRKAVFRMIWHRNRAFDLLVDLEAGTLRFPNLLPNVPADAAMYRELKAFVKARHADDLPEHRRIDTSKAHVRPYNRQGSVSLVLTMKDGDCQYGARKLIHLVHEIFLTFLTEGSCLEYMVETFDLDPDRM